MPVPGVAVPAGDEEVLLDREEVVVDLEVAVVPWEVVVVTRVDDDDGAEELLEVVVEAVPGIH